MVVIVVVVVVVEDGVGVEVVGNGGEEEGWEERSII